MQISKSKTTIFQINKYFLHLVYPLKSKISKLRSPWKVMKLTLLTEKCTIVQSIYQPIKLNELMKSNWVNNFTGSLVEKYMKCDTTNKNLST